MLTFTADALIFMADALTYAADTLIEQDALAVGRFDQPLDETFISIQSRTEMNGSLYDLILLTTMPEYSYHVNDVIPREKSLYCRPVF